MRSLPRSSQRQYVGVDPIRAVDREPTRFRNFGYRLTVTAQVLTRGGLNGGGGHADRRSVSSGLHRKAQTGRINTIMLMPMVVRAQTAVWDAREKWRNRDEEGLEQVALLLIILAVAVIIVVVVLLAVRGSIEGVTTETTNQLDESVRQFE